MISGDLYNSGMNFKFMFSGGMFWHVLKVHALIFSATPSSGINKPFFCFHSIITELDLQSAFQGISYAQLSPRYRNLLNHNETLRRGFQIVLFGTSSPVISLEVLCVMADSNLTWLWEDQHG